MSLQAGDFNYPAIGMNFEATLRAWLRFYTVLICVSLLLGLSGALIYTLLREERYEASTIIVQSGRSIVPRQLGSVAQTLFRSSAIYGPVIRDLGAETEVEEFLSSQAELVPIPEAPTLIVVGRSASPQNAGEISLGMANQLVEALNVQVGAREFSIFSGPEPSRLPGAIGASLVLSSGALAGLWAGAGVALIHYRWRRPVLTLGRALRLSGAAQVAILENEVKRRWWKAIIRVFARPRTAARNEVRLAWLESSIAGRSVQVQGLESAHAGERLERRLNARKYSGDGRGLHGGSQDVLVILAGARTGEDAIVASRLAAGTTEDSRRDRVALVWLR